jgi:hypothetical protein
MYDNNDFIVLNDAPTDVISATHVAEHKKSLFFGKGTTFYHLQHLMLTIVFK